MELFAFLHDSCRDHDGGDPKHGERGAELAASQNGKFYDLTGPQLDTLCRAIRGHSTDHMSTDITIQPCWDADRLDLGRVGIMPSPQLLSNEAAPYIADAYEWARGRATTSQETRSAHRGGGLTQGSCQKK